MQLATMASAAAGLNQRNEQLSLDKNKVPSRRVSESRINLLRYQIQGFINHVTL